MEDKPTEFSAKQEIVDGEQVHTVGILLKRGFNFERVFSCSALKSANDLVLFTDNFRQVIQ